MRKCSFIFVLKISSEQNSMRTHAPRTDVVFYSTLRSLLCSGNRAHSQLTGHRIARVHCARAAYLSSFTCFMQLLHLVCCSLFQLLYTCR